MKTTITEAPAIPSKAIRLFEWDADEFAAFVYKLLEQEHGITITGDSVINIDPYNREMSLQETYEL